MADIDEDASLPDDILAPDEPSPEPENMETPDVVEEMEVGETPGTENMQVTEETVVTETVDELNEQIDDILQEDTTPAPDTQTDTDAGKADDITEEADDIIATIEETVNQENVNEKNADKETVSEETCDKEVVNQENVNEKSADKETGDTETGKGEVGSTVEEADDKDDEEVDKVDVLPETDLVDTKDIDTSNKDEEATENDASGKEVETKSDDGDANEGKEIKEGDTTNKGVDIKDGDTTCEGIDSKIPEEENTQEVEHSDEEYVEILEDGKKKRTRKKRDKSKDGKSPGSKIDADKNDKTDDTKSPSKDFLPTGSEMDTSAAADDFEIATPASNKRRSMNDKGFYRKLNEGHVEPSVPKQVEAPPSPAGSATKIKKGRTKLSTTAAPGEILPEWVIPMEQGWKRELVLRNPVEGVKRQADVYYHSPMGHKLRSGPNIETYLIKHGIPLSLKNFTFRKDPIYKEPFEVVRTAGAAPGRGKKRGSIGGTPDVAATPSPTPSGGRGRPKKIKRDSSATPELLVRNDEILVDKEPPKKVKLTGDGIAVVCDNLPNSPPPTSGATPMKVVKSAGNRFTIVKSTNDDKLIVTPTIATSVITVTSRASSESPMTTSEGNNSRSSTPASTVIHTIDIVNPSPTTVGTSGKSTPVLGRLTPLSVSPSPSDTGSITPSGAKQKGKPGRPRKSSTPLSSLLPRPKSKTPDLSEPPIIIPEDTGEKTPVSILPPSIAPSHPVKIVMTVGNPGTRPSPSILSAPQVIVPRPTAAINMPIPIVAPRAIKKVPKPNPTQKMCNLDCPGQVGVPPTVHCDICMCLFHPRCVQKDVTREGFVCRVCSTLDTDMDLDDDMICLNNTTTTEVLRPLPPLKKGIPRPGPKSKTRPPTSPGDKENDTQTVLTGQIISLPTNISAKIDPNKPINLKLSGKRFSVPPNCIVKSGDSVKVLLPPETLNGEHIENVDPGAVSVVGLNKDEILMQSMNMSALNDPPRRSSTDKDPPSRRASASPVNNTSNNKSGKVIDLTDNESSDKDKESSNNKSTESAKKTSAKVSTRKWPPNPFQRIHLGVDVMMCIFQYLNPAGLCVASRVCRTWKNIADIPSLWRCVRLRNIKITDWERCAAKLQSHYTQQLDLRGIIHLSKDKNRTWMQFHLILEYLGCLRKVYLPQCPTSIVQSVAEKLSTLSLVSAEFIVETMQEPQMWTENTKLDVAKFSKQTQLEELRLRGICGITLPSFSFTGGLSAINVLSKLRVLSLTTLKEVPGHEFSFLKNLINLEILELGDCDMWDSQTYSQLSSLEKLESLRLETGGDINGLGLGQAISQLKQLRQLELIRFSISQSDAEHIQKVKSLETLSIWPEGGTHVAKVNTNIKSAVYNMPFLKQLEWGIMVAPPGAVGGGGESPTPDSIPFIANSAALEGGDGIDLLPEYISVNQLIERLSDRLLDTKIRVFKVPMPRR